MVGSGVESAFLPGLTAIRGSPDFVGGGGEIEMLKAAESYGYDVGCEGCAVVGGRDAGPTATAVGRVIERGG